MERHGAAHRIKTTRTQDPTAHHQPTRAPRPAEEEVVEEEERE